MGRAAELARLHALTAGYAQPPGDAAEASQGDNELLAHTATRVGAVDVLGEPARREGPRMERYRWWEEPPDREDSIWGWGVPWFKGEFQLPLRHVRGPRLNMGIGRRYWGVANTRAHAEFGKGMMWDAHTGMYFHAPFRRKMQLEEKPGEVALYHPHRKSTLSAPTQAFLERHCGTDWVRLAPDLVRALDAHAEQPGEFAPVVVEQLPHQWEAYHTYVSERLEEIRTGTVHEEEEEEEEGGGEETPYDAVRGRLRSMLARVECALQRVHTQLAVLLAMHERKPVRDVEERRVVLVRRVSRAELVRAAVRERLLHVQRLADEYTAFTRGEDNGEGEDTAAASPLLRILPERVRGMFHRLIAPMQSDAHGHWRAALREHHARFFEQQQHAFSNALAQDAAAALIHTEAEAEAEAEARAREVLRVERRFYELVHARLQHVLHTGAADEPPQVRSVLPVLAPPTEHVAVQVPPFPCAGVDALACLRSVVHRLVPHMSRVVRAAAPRVLHALPREEQELLHAVRVAQLEVADAHKPRGDDAEDSDVAAVVHARVDAMWAAHIILQYGSEGVAGEDEVLAAQRLVCVLRCEEDVLRVCRGVARDGHALVSRVTWGDVCAWFATHGTPRACATVAALWSLAPETVAEAPDEREGEGEGEGEGSGTAAESVAWVARIGVDVGMQARLFCHVHGCALTSNVLVAFLVEHHPRIAAHVPVLRRLTRVPTESLRRMLEGRVGHVLEAASNEEREALLRERRPFASVLEDLRVLWLRGNDEACVLLAVYLHTRAHIPVASHAEQAQHAHVLVHALLFGVYRAVLRGRGTMRAFWAHVRATHVRAASPRARPAALLHGMAAHWPRFKTFCRTGLLASRAQLLSMPSGQLFACWRSFHARAV